MHGDHGQLDPRPQSSASGPGEQPSGITTSGNTSVSSVRLNAVTPHARPSEHALRIVGRRQNAYDGGRARPRS